jgi:cell division transport system permease protein
MAGHGFVIFGHGAGAAILPRQGTTGTALIIVMTIMSFLACLAVWATISIAAATDAWTAGIANTITVELKPPDTGPVDPKAVETALNLLAKTPGVAKARALEAQETAALIEPWLGAAGLDAALPLPVLIDVKLSRRADLDVPGLTEALAKAVPGATVDDHTRWTARLLAVSHSLTLISLTVLALVLLAATAIIVFATRAGLLAHGGIVEILHLSGAQSEFIAAEFARHFLRLGVRAGVMGLAAALATLFLVYLLTLSSDTDDTVSLVPRMALSPLALLGLLIVPVGAAFISTLTARITVLNTLERMP